MTSELRLRPTPTRELLSPIERAVGSRDELGVEHEHERTGKSGGEEDGVQVGWEEEEEKEEAATRAAECMF